MYNRAGANAKGTHLKITCRSPYFCKKNPPIKLLGTARIIFPGYFIRGQDILSPKASSYIRLQPSCPVGYVALYPTAIDFWKGKRCMALRYDKVESIYRLQPGFDGVAARSTLGRSTWL